MNVDLLMTGSLEIHELRLDKQACGVASSETGLVWTSNKQKLLLFVFLAKESNHVRSIGSAAAGPRRLASEN
jgi:hypothetical protein